MTPREVAGLDELARAYYGRSLPTNPKTGLPEAGLFDEIKKVGKVLLPVAAGAVLGPAGFGLTAGQAALTAGAIRGITSGSLEKGMMFGLGAYGGAGISGALMNTGTQMAANAALAGDLGAAVGDPALAAAQAAQTAQASPLSTMGQGVKGLLEKGGRDTFMKEVGGLSGLAKYGMATAAPVLLAPPKTTTNMPAAQMDREPYRYAYDPGRVRDPEATYAGAASGERTYFNPTFQRLAAGGPVENMSAANVYDMQNARGGVSDMGVDMSTGMQRMAGGGAADDRYSGNRYVFGPIDAGRRFITEPSQKTSGLDEDYTYIYDPITKTYKRVLKAEVKPGGDSTAAGAPGTNTSGGGGDGSLGGPSSGYGDFGLGLIGLGQAVSGLGLTGLGNAIAGPGIGVLGAAEAAAAQDAATAYGLAIADAVGMSGFGDMAGGLAAADAVGMSGFDGVGGFSGSSDASASAGDLGGMGAGDMGGGDSGGMGGGDSGGGDGGGGGCVDPAVLIMLADGRYVPAGNIKVGDALFAMHEKTLEFGAYPVEHSEEVQQPKAVVLFEDGSSMLVSHSHKFFMVGGEWKQTYQLEPGDTVKAAPGANNKTVLGLEPQGEGPVMKITVKDAHTYISEGLISHNMKAKGGIVRRNMGGITALAGGGYNLGDYSDGGRLLRGPGDGVSDSIPAVIGQKRPARLADGEFVIPARIVSELGNGSTEAGARKLYAMMDRVQRARGKTTGKGKVAKNTRADKYLPA
jgi:hypothetical protein